MVAMKIYKDKAIYYSTNCHYAHIWQGSPQYLSSVHDRYPAIYVNDHIWKCTADFLSLLVWWPFWKVRQFKQCSPDLIPWKKLFTIKCSQKSQRVFASAHKDIQRVTWNFHSENSTKKMLLRTKQHTCSRKVVKLKKFKFTGRGLTLGKEAIFFLLCLVISKHEFVNKSF